MNRIDTIFKRLKQEQKAAFIGFLTAGDLGIPTYMGYMEQLKRNSCDIVKIGIPFSDPIAEEPVIQKISLRALRNDITTETVIRMVPDIHELSQISLVFLLYYSQIFRYRIGQFLGGSEAAGTDTLIIFDLSMKHREELKPLADAHYIQLIPLVTPVSNVRKKSIAEQSGDFLRCVISLGITGERTEFQADSKAFPSKLFTYSDMPKTPSFGISAPQQIAGMKSYVGGVIAGGVTVWQIGRPAKQGITLEEIGSFVKILANVVHAQKGTMRSLLAPIATNASPFLQMYLLYRLPSSAHVNRRLLCSAVMIYQLSTNRIHAEAKMHSLFSLYGGIPFTLG